MSATLAAGESAALLEASRRVFTEAVILTAVVSAALAAAIVTATLLRNVGASKEAG